MEIFKPIKGYENKYEISNYGRVRSLGYTKDSRKRSIKILKGDKNKKGYIRVSLFNPFKRFLIHQLVAYNFLDNSLNKPCVNHIDNNPSNNHIDNLEWCSYSENLFHAQQQNRLFKTQHKGGITTSIKAKQKAMVRANDMIGKVFHNWLVLDNLGLMPCGKLKDGRLKLKCKCINCNNESVIDEAVVRNRESTMCKYCRLKYLYHKAIKKIQEKYINKTFNNWVIINIDNINQSTNTKYLKLKAKCLICGNEKLIPYTTIITASKPMPKCLMCSKKIKI